MTSTTDLPHLLAAAVLSLLAAGASAASITVPAALQISTWEALDGSKVAGKMKASASPSPDAIAWLLLDVTSAQGSGLFGRITAIQRLATEAGKAPPDGCAAGSLGQEVRVPYKAVYRFYTAQ